MIVITEIKTYKCSDGIIFNTEKEALDHEKKYDNVIVYEVTQTTIDQVTTRNVLLVHVIANPTIFVEEWCYRNFGNRYMFKTSIHTSSNLFAAWAYRLLDRKVKDLNENDIIIGRIEDDLIEKVIT